MNNNKIPKFFNYLIIIVCLGLITIAPFHASLVVNDIIYHSFPFFFFVGIYGFMIGAHQDDELLAILSGILLGLLINDSLRGFPPFHGCFRPLNNL